MANSLKKMWTAVAVSLVSATSFVGAHANVNNGGCCNLNTCCYDAIPNYCNSGSGDFSVCLEALYWKAHEDGLAYGTEVTIPVPTAVVSPASTTTTILSRVKHPHFKWDWGFRLGFAYALPCDCWGLALNWTNFRTHGTNFSHFPSGTSTITGVTTFFVPAWGRSDLIATGIVDTEAKIRLRYDAVDLELGRPFCISQCLTLRPHIGVRGAWVRQHYEILNTLESAVTGVELLTGLQDVNLKCNYDGVGLRGGLDSTWDLGCGASLYGQAAGSILYGRYEIDSHDEYSFTTVAPLAFFDVHQKDDFWACRAITDLALGVRWKGCFCNDAIALTLSVDWEQHMFFDMNEFEDFVNLSSVGVPPISPAIGDVKNPEFSRGNLCLSGVSFGAKIDF